MKLVRWLIRNWGLLPSVMIMTTASAILSGMMTSVIVYLVEDTFVSQRLIFGIIVPAVISPVFIYTTLHLVRDLDHAHEEMRRLSNMDVLTGVSNRRLLIRQAEVEIARARRYGGTVGLLMLDVDGFKQVNDIWGHQAGDALLVDLAQTCAALCRENDVFARLGGDEFAFLIPNANREGIAAFSARVLEAVRTVATPCGDANVSARVSLGAALLGPDDIDLTQLMRRADHALYDAKHAGGDSVTHDKVG